MKRSIIQGRRIIEDTWHHLTDDEAPQPGADVTVSLGRWLEQAQALRAHDGRLGVRVAPTDDPMVLDGHLRGVSMVAVDFPKFADGRGYSHARNLRVRLGWRGQLRATGDVLRDQLFYMARVGFDAFEVRADKSAEDALAAFDTFSVRYQGSVDEPLPAFRRPLQAADEAA